MIAHLSSRTVHRASGRAHLPLYDRNRISPGIVHLGAGAFHRAHQAMVIDDCLEDGQLQWGIVAASLRSRMLRDVLTPQNGLYSLSTGSESSGNLRVVGSLLAVLCGLDDRRALLDALVAPTTRIVTLTVTEKGYYRRRDSLLDRSHPDVRADLSCPERPATIFGVLAAAIEHRRMLGRAPFTVVSCDNIPANGATFKRLLIEFASIRSEPIARYIDNQVSFPSTMVDRIVPAADQALRDKVAERLGLADAARSTEFYHARRSSRGRCRNI